MADGDFASVFSCQAVLTFPHAQRPAQPRVISLVEDGPEGMAEAKNKEVDHFSIRDFSGIYTEDPCFYPNQPKKKEIGFCRFGVLSGFSTDISWIYTEDPTMPPALPELKSGLKKRRSHPERWLLLSFERSPARDNAGVIGLAPIVNPA